MKKKKKKEKAKAKAKAEEKSQDEGEGGAEEEEEEEGDCGSLLSVACAKNWLNETCSINIKYPITCRQRRYQAFC